MDDKERQALLFDAIQHDNDTFLDDLLASEEGKNLLDSPDRDGNMLLHVAVLDNRPRCIDCLLKHGANPNVFDTNRARTPLHLAIELGHIEIVHKFLRLENINLSLHDDRNLTCYEIAQLCDNLVLADLIKSRYDELSQLKEDFYSIINQACTDNNPKLVRELLEGQLKNLVAKMKQHSHDNEDHVLFAHSRIKDLINWSSPSRNDVTLLFKSASRGFTEVCEVLIEHGATAKCNENTNYSPLYVAAYSGHTETVKLLLNSFPSLITEITIEKWTILHACCLQGHSETASLILNYPYPDELKRPFKNGQGTYEYKFAFDLNAQDAAGQTVVYLAVSANNEKLLDTLLEFNVQAEQTELDSVNKIIKISGKTPAAGDNNPSKNRAYIVPDKPKILLRTYGSENNRVDCAANKPNKNIDKIIRQLHKLDECAPSSITHKEKQTNSPGKKYLICPFDLDTYCDFNSKTALHLAICRKNHKVASALLVNGSDPNLPILTKSSNDRNNDFRDHVSSPTNSNEGNNSSLSSQENEDSMSWTRVTRSTCLKEACRANDDVMCDLLIRYGARDDNNLALEIAASNNNDILISRLLALNSHVDNEYRINKKCNVEFASRYKDSRISHAGSSTSLVGQVTTFSSMFPSAPVIIDWHNLKFIKRIDPQWLIEASLYHNKRLKHSTTSLMAITRLDLSSNNLKSIHPVIFRLPSLRELNLSKNRLESLLDFSSHRVSTDGNATAPTQRLIESHRVAMKRSRSANLSSINLESSNNIDLDEPLEWDLPYLETLDLHDNLLISLPDYLFKLPRLRELDVSSNQIRQLPSTIWTAPLLKDVSASGNLLDDLPRYILPNNQQSRLNNSTRNLDSQNNPNITRDGQFNQRDQFYQQEKPFLLDLDDYSEYEFDATSIDMDCQNYWKQRVELISSNRQNQLSNLNRTFDDNDLPMRDKGDNLESDNICRLTSLNLSHNSFTYVPPVLACIATDLTRLNLSHNRIQSMWDLYLYPHKLKTLDLSHNQITSLYLPPPVGDLPEKVKRLCHACTTNAEIYDCCHKMHIKLEHLKSLNLSHNMIDDFILYSTIAPSEYRRSSKGLIISDSPEFTTTSQDLCKKQLASEILAYPNVTTLDLSSNKLSSIPKQISKLKDLSVLNLSHNMNIFSLPPELGLASKLWNLGLTGCCLGEPLKSIIESKTYKTMDVIGYLRSILEESKPYARLKLMLVGLQGIGKTSLLEQLRQEGSSGGGLSRRRLQPEHWTKRMGHASRSNLRNQRGVTLSTVGVDIHDWCYQKKVARNQHTFGPVSFSTWDFGGQEEFYATHRYFLSKRSLYLVVWKLTDGIGGILGIQQWLVNIQSRASSSPVIIVGTHEDLIEGGVNGEHVRELQAEIHKRFIDVTDYDKCGLPRVMGSIIVSTKTKLNIKLLCDRIYDVAFSLKCPGSSERLLEQKIPATYLYLEEIIHSIVLDRHQRRREPVLTYYEYRKLTSDLLYSRYNKTFRDLEPLNSRELNYNSELQQATRFLHENGVLLHYEDANLRDLYFLDPQWLCDILSHVVTIREINPHVKCGLMKIDDLAFLFKSLEVDMNGGVKSYVVNLLNKFEVALTWNSQYLLIPSLLPPDADAIQDSAPNSQFAIADFQVRLAPRARGRSAVRRLDAAAASKRSVSIDASRKRNSLTPQQMSGSTEVEPKSGPNKSLIRLEIEQQQMQTVHRLVLLRYLPAGFFARLQSAILSDVKFEEICSEIQLNLINNLPADIMQLAEVTDQIGGRAGWTCWKNGIRLSSQQESTINSQRKPHELVNHLFSIEELRTSQNNQFKSKTSPIIGQNFMVERAQSFDNIKGTHNNRQTHIDTANTGEIGTKHVDVIKSKWCDLNLNDYSNILVITVPSWRLKVMQQNSSMGNLKHYIELDKQNRAQLLALAVDHIDNLLEDWYPSLGARFAHTLGGNYLVTRIAPCINCFNATRNFYDSSAIATGRQSRHARQTRLMTTNRINPFPTISPHLATNANIKSIFDKQQSTIHSYYVERCILAAYNISQDISSDDQDVALLNDLNRDIRRQIPSRFSATMGRKNKPVQIENLHCPKHGSINLATIAPDVVFDDVSKEYKIHGDNIDRCKLIGRGTFGFVFKGNLSLNVAAHNPVDQEVALKVLQPVDPGPEAEHSDLVAYKLIKSNWLREPFECVCRSYCTARHEVNILQSVFHPNLVNFIGICTRPLAVVLELAPLGSLGDIFKSYKRSAMRIDQWSAQKTILQIAKALEFLHQQRIIYRDLKAENILVWQFPSAFATNLQEASVEVKLADYGISRQALPTGIWKGFAGTINFLAPEILRHDGDEEYTEKVDCFSFGMFMYELLTLKPPYNHNEGIRSHLAEGVKPTLTKRDLIYPSYMLDLMSICWSYEPHLRPTSSQIVSIASTPEFMHLYDVISVDHDVAGDNHIHFCQAIQYYENRNLHTSNYQAGCNSIDLWMGRQNFNLDILSSDLNSWSDYVRLEDKSASTISAFGINQADRVAQATAMCTIGGRIWICDTNLNMHIMPLIPRLMKQSVDQFNKSRISSTTIDLCSGINRVQTFGLDFSKCKNKPNRTYVEQLVGVERANSIILLMKTESVVGRLYVLDLDTMQVSCLDDNCLKINCIAVLNGSKFGQSKKNLLSDQDDQFKIFCGHLNGISCIEIRNQSIFRQRILNLSEKSRDLTGEQVLDPSQSAEINHIVINEGAELVWTAAGCTVHLWSFKDQCVARKLDCWKLVPCSESLESINIEQYYDQSRSSVVSSMIYLKDQLFIGTDHGCFMVVEAPSLKPIIVFRPYESSILILKPLLIGSRDTWTHQGDAISNIESNSDDLDSCNLAKESPYLITIGSSYRDLMLRYVSSLDDSTNVEDMTRGRKQVAILWSADYNYEY